MISQIYLSTVTSQIHTHTHTREMHTQTQACKRTPVCACVLLKFNDYPLSMYGAINFNVGHLDSFIVEYWAFSDKPPGLWNQGSWDASPPYIVLEVGGLLLCHGCHHAHMRKG